MVTQKNKLNIPSSWPGSIPEFLVYNSLTTTFGMTDGIEFTYQSSFMGGRLDKGGMVVDFVFNNPPDLAVNVQGVYYHYEFGVESKARDMMARASLAGQNITLIFIDDDDLMRDRMYYCREALNYQDHSRLGGG